MQPGPEIFISYAHADNPPRYESIDWEHRRGWVDCFHATLTERLRQVRGKATEVWRDDDATALGGASVLTDTIRDALERTSVLVGIASPSYSGSAWCKAEFDFFRQSWAARGGLRVGNRSRFIKATKLPLPTGSFLESEPAVADSVGYPFHRLIDGLPLEYDPPNGRIAGEDFCRRINALAYDLATILDSREQSTPSGKTISFGATSPDMSDRRERLSSELRQHGHEVIEGSAEGLARAHLSIHLIGNTYDAAEVRDYEAAGAAASNGLPLRLAWLPPDANIAEPAQADFVERLKLDPRFFATSVSLEAFKSIVKDELRKTDAPAPEPHRASTSPDAPGELRRVYLVFDAPDREGAKAIDDWLYAAGFEVLKPATGGDAAAFRKLHNGRIKSSDGVLIYHGSADDQWLESKLDELWKVYAASRHKRPRARGIVLADPPTPYKRDFRARIAHVIPGFGTLNPGLFEEFIEDVRSDASSA